VKKNVLALSVASALSIFAAQQARAAGFALYEQGISGMGNAYAGAAAVAEDATTVWWNPAGMSRLPKGMHASVGVAAIAPSWKFHDNGSTVGSFGRSGRMAGDFHWIHYFALDSKGNVFTTEVDNAKRAQKFLFKGDTVLRKRSAN